MTVLFAMAAAVLYGLADFIGGVASRRTSVWPIGLLACTGGAAGSLVLALVTRGDPSGSDLVLGLVGGIGSGVGTAFLYRGLAAGRMGVVAPVSGVGAALVPLVVAVVGGERPALIGWVGIIIALPGIWLVSRDSAPTPERSRATNESGLLDGLIAGLGFGLLFATLGHVGPSAGYWPLAAAQGVSILTLVGTAFLVGGDPRPRHAGDFWGLVPGLMGALAVMMFLLATHHGLLSIAAVISSLYPAFTVLLAIGFLRERVHRSQAWGLLLCAASVVCVSLA